LTRPTEQAGPEDPQEKPGRLELAKKLVKRSGIGRKIDYISAGGRIPEGGINPLFGQLKAPCVVKTIVDSNDVVVFHAFGYRAGDSCFGS